MADPPPFLGSQLFRISRFTPDRESPHASMTISRGGLFGLSRTQLENKRRAVFRNGAADVVRISPEQLADAGDSVLLLGEPDLDTIIPDGMPGPQRNPDGVIIWRIKRPDGTAQQITATGFGFVAQRN